MTLTEQEMLAELRKFDTPSITNVVATYPGNPLCLGLYNPWTENWYTDTTIRCMYPELGAVAGYAVTCVYGLPDPNYSELSFMDVVDALHASQKPTILALQQKFPPELANKVGLAGGNMTAAMKSVGCLGAISNGPSRDIDEIRPMEFQYLLSGISPGHGAMAVQAVNVPVSIAGMDVSPGEIIHMDENGACKFPGDKLEAVLTNVKALLKEEGDRIGQLLSGPKTAKQVRAIFRDILMLKMRMNRTNKVDIPCFNALLSRDVIKNGENMRSFGTRGRVYPDKHTMLCSVLKSLGFHQPH